MEPDSDPSSSPRRALVVEGGGMRGAYSAGVMAGLHDAGQSFDAVYASSSGACSAAYLVAGQRHGIEIWRSHLHGSRLIGLNKLLRRGCILDLDYLIHDVFAKQLPLDHARLRESPTPLYVVLTRASDGEPEYHDIRKARDPLGLLKASAALPVAYGRPVLYEGRLYVDGAMSDPLPVARAIRDGAREVLVIRTRPEGYRRPPARELFVRLATLPYPGAAAAMRSLHTRYNEAVAEAARRSPEVRVRVVWPPPSLRLGRLTRSARALRRAILQGMEDAARLVAAPEVAARPGKAAGR